MFFEKMLKGEGLFEEVFYDKSVPISSFERALQYFIEQSEIIIIECESQEDEEKDLFYIGVASELENDKVWFLEFDATGKWEDEEVAIKLEKITRINFNTPYINIFSKYLQTGE